ncbi:MAG: hypothetical protein LBK95_17720 [Bifidobacteriaceae bacterium]|jgi:predicted unusual protein kinase regulating ubiquinone biosynthesis (AarF/ABC1/UbiB family)|nr:hypothetical protein [Bifidobacteriaceae bacterium]
MAKDFSRLTGMARYRATMRVAARIAWQLWWLNKTARFMRPARLAERRHRLYTAQARTFTRLATEMGGLVIKLGQHVSTRVDLLPTEYTIELARLQDAVPAVPTPAIRAEIERELQQPVAEVYRAFEDEPLAAASLGQVHRAELADGTPVAVKVLRPGIEDLVQTDLRSMKTILRWVDRLTTVGTGFDLDMFYGEFEDTLLAELDMIAEGANAERFQASFLLNPNIDMPRIHWRETTRRVLTMELMEGVKINALAQLDAAGIDRSQLARDLLEVYLQMVLRDGFFHADPHPGNILVRSDGTILLLDFGMVGTVPENLHRDIPELALALFGRDWRRSAELLDRMGFLREGADSGLLAAALEPMVARVLGASTGESSLDDDAVEELRLFMYSQPFQLPGRIAFLGKTLINLTGVALGLDPKMNLMEELVPLVRAAVTDPDGARGGPGVLGWLAGLPGFERLAALAEAVGLTDLPAAAQAGRLLGPAGLGQLRDLAGAALPTARNVVELAAKANAGGLVVKLGRSQEARLARSRAEQTGRLVRAGIGGVMALSGVQLLVAATAEPLGGVLAGLGALVMLFQARNGRGRHKRPR